MEGLYYLCSENKGFVFAYAKRWFSHDAAQLPFNQTLLSFVSPLKIYP